MSPSYYDSHMIRGQVATRYHGRIQLTCVVSERTTYLIGGLLVSKIPLCFVTRCLHMTAMQGSTYWSRRGELLDHLRSRRKCRPWRHQTCIPQPCTPMVCPRVPFCTHAPLLCFLMVLVPAFWPWSTVEAQPATSVPPPFFQVDAPSPPVVGLRCDRLASDARAQPRCSKGVWRIAIWGVV